MEYGRDMICPQCRRAHGPAAKSCECGHVFEEPKDEPAPAMHFVILGLIFGAATVFTAARFNDIGFFYFPFWGMIGSAVAFALAAKSWLYYWRKRK